MYRQAMATASAEAVKWKQICKFGDIKKKTHEFSCQGKDCLKIWGAGVKNKSYSTCKPQGKDFGIGSGYNELEILCFFFFFKPSNLCFVVRSNSYTVIQPFKV